MVLPGAENEAVAGPAWLTGDQRGVAAESVSGCSVGAVESQWPNVLTHTSAHTCTHVHTYLHMHTHSQAHTGLPLGQTLQYAHIGLIPEGPVTSPGHDPSRKPYWAQATPHHSSGSPFSSAQEAGSSLCGWAQLAHPSQHRVPDTQLRVMGTTLGPRVVPPSAQGVRVSVVSVSATVHKYETM